MHRHRARDRREGPNSSSRSQLTRLEAFLIFEESRLSGAYLIRLHKIRDERGYFARAWCRREFEEHGLRTDLAQANVSLTRRKGTLRGIHYQVPPVAETKLVRCTRGEVYEVILDLRPGSPTYRQWNAVTLSAENCTLLYVPEGIALGSQTLTDDVEVFYQLTEFYSPQHERGVRWDDPAFGIEWPEEVTAISEKDRAWPDYFPDPALEHAF